MTDARQALIDNAIDAQLTANGADVNHDIYDWRLLDTQGWPQFKRVPMCIYFYYVRLDTDGKVRVDHYLYIDPNRQPIPYEDVKDIIYDLALNARPSTSIKDPPRLSSKSFEPIPWKYWSYIAIFVDEANWLFHRRSDGKSAVVFEAAPKPNKSFFDASDVILDMPRDNGTTDRRSAIFFINHMKKNSAGDNIGHESYEYKFNMWLDAKYANPSNVGMTVIFDPGGTNTGPPEDPP